MVEEGEMEHGQAKVSSPKVLCCWLLLLLSDGAFVCKDRKVCGITAAVVEGGHRYPSNGIRQGCLREREIRCLKRKNGRGDWTTLSVREFCYRSV